MSEPKHPMQPLVEDHGVIRFKENKIVRWLVDKAREIGKPPPDLNEISIVAQERGWIDDMVQFWQQLGYSVSGYGDLDFVPREVIDAADAEAAKLLRTTEPETPPDACTIWKTTLHLMGAQDIEIPAGAELLCAHEQFGKICVWYRCNPAAPKEKRRVAIIGTGNDAPAKEHGRYIGSAVLAGGQFVFHIFEQIGK